MGMLESQVQSALAMMQRTEQPNFYTEFWKTVYFIARVTGNFEVMQKMEWIKKKTSNASRDPLSYNETFYNRLKFQSPMAANDYREHLDQADMSMRLLLYVMMQGMKLGELFPTEIEINPEILAQLPSADEIAEEIGEADQGKDRDKKKKKVKKVVKRRADRDDQQRSQSVREKLDGIIKVQEQPE